MSRLSDAPIVHGSVVSRRGRGLLILGGSGSGKSGLALRMMALGAELVADDRVLLARRGDALVASVPPAIAGLIEARGVGLLRTAFVAETVLVCAVDLDRAGTARLPQPETITHSGVTLDLISGGKVPNIEAVLTILLDGGRADIE